MNQQNEKMFTWVKTHKELAQYLSKMEGKQKELIELLKEAGCTQFYDKDTSDSTFDLEEIDPFTFFAYINKYGDAKRLVILQNIAEKLGLSRPEDTTGLPTTNALNVRFFPYKYERVNNEIDRLWSLFYHALDHTISDELFADTLSIHSTGKASLTAALFYINPETYLPINGPAIPYLSKHLSIDINIKTFSDYQRILDQVTKKIDLPIYEISHEAWLWTEEYEKNEAIRKQWLELAEQYKVYLKDNRNYDEIYKWEAIKHFQNVFNLKADDFSTNLKDAMAKSYNLLYQNSKGFITKAVEYFPDQVRKMFEDLYDESKPLEDRFDYFVEKSKELEPNVSQEYGKELNHQQDERTLSYYLTMRNPDQYPLYKDEVYQYLISEVTKEKSKSAGEKFFHYLEIGEKLIAAVEDDEDLIELATKNLNDDCYSGEQKWLIFQDILWLNMKNIDGESDQQYWLFQCNPSIYDLEGSLKKDVLNSWMVKVHNDKIKPGDKVILWMSGKKRGCYALAEVDSEVQELEVSEPEIKYFRNENDTVKTDRVKLKITHNLVESPITEDQFKNDSRLTGLKIGNQGTNFSATQEEYEAIRDLAEQGDVDSKWIRLQQTVQKIDNHSAIRKFFRSVRYLLNELDLIEGQPNIYSAAVDFYIHLTIGGKYLIYVQFKKGVLELSYHVPRSQLETIRSKYPSLEYSDGYNDKSADTVFVKFHPDEIDPDDVLDSTIEAGKALKEKFSKSSYRKIYPEANNPWIIRVAQNDELLEKLLNGDSPNNTEQRNMISYPLNTIFYGPPGTGKTYTTIKRAAEIVEGRVIEDYDVAKEIFHKRLGDEIEFITFHQNYSYEDFIQGLRPDIESSQALTFERTDGVFKKLADKALKNLQSSEKPQTKKKTFEKVFNDYIEPLIEGEVEEIEVEMKRVSFFITAVTDKSIEFRKTNGNTAHTLSINTLRKMYDAESVLEIQGLSSYYSPLLKELLNRGKSPGVTEVVQRKNYVLIIDEINRANISRVFGELITLIEPDKRYGNELHIPAKLPSGESFSVPKNLHIIGTMNTADKSIALLDIALRRRFEFEAMYPKYEIEGAIVHDAEVLKKINERITLLKGHDFQIGHSYFMKNGQTLQQRMNRRVIPLLLEYFMNDEKEVRGILESAGLVVVDKSWPLEIEV